jgi:hypothetical protein
VWRTSASSLTARFNAAPTLFTYSVGLAEATTSERQEGIAKRQGEIAEQQHQILQNQLSRRADLRVISRSQHTEFGSEGIKPTTIRLRVLNRGSKAADGFHWEIVIPRALAFTVTFVDDDGKQIPGVWAPFSETEGYDKQEGHYPHKLFSSSDVQIAILAVDADRGPRVPEFTIRLRIRGEDGLSPTSGLAEIHYRRLPDGMYEVRHPWPDTQP